MATVSKTYTENTNASYKATWVLSATGTDLAPTTNAFTVPRPTLSAKYTYSGKYYASVDVSYDVYINNINTYQRYSYYRGQQGDLSKMVATASGSTYTLSSYSNNTTQTLYLSNYFTSSNPTVRTLPITIKDSYAGSTFLSSSNTSNADGSMFNCYQGGTAVALGTIGYLTLNAPPTFTSSTLSKDTADYYVGLTTVSVTISGASAKYGGTITSSSLTIGSQTVTGSGNGTLSMTLANVGTFAPTVSVTDSRGQTTTTTLTQITVNQYTVPSLAFNVIRSDSSGIPDDEGEYGVASATFSYTDAVASLLQPSVTVTDENGQSVTTTTTWYETWTSSTGVSSAVNWTNYNPDAPVTLYGLISGSFSPSETYTVTIVANDSEGGTSTPITQTLSTGFFTIDFQAGGKEIAFGAPANDTLTQTQENVGLFKCNMEASFRDNNNVVRMLFDFVYPVGSYYETSDTTFDPNITWGGTWTLETAGQVHVSAGTGYSVSGALSNTTDGGTTTHTHTTGNHTLTESQIPSHNHPIASNGVGMWIPNAGSSSRSRVASSSSGSIYCTSMSSSGGYTWQTTTANRGSGGAHNHGDTGNGSNMQPYIIVNRWHRTA